MRIAVLALQGAFAEHEQMLGHLGAETFEIRQLKDWSNSKDGLIIPGGESTTQSKLLHDLGLFEPIKKDIIAGLPVFGTCAGLILLSPLHFATLGIVAERNAYGRQLGSFHTSAKMDLVGDEIPMTFIRAPYISRLTNPLCHALAEVDGRIVAARQDNQLVTAFHPELDNDTRVHDFFLSIVKQNMRNG